MRVTRRGVLQGLTASVGLLNMPAIVIRASADAEPPPLRRGEILPDPDFSLLSPTTPFIVGIRPHRVGGVCLKLEDEPIPSRCCPRLKVTSVTPSSERSLSSATFIGPGEGAVPGAGCGKAVDMAV